MAISRCDCSRAPPEPIDAASGPVVLSARGVEVRYGDIVAVNGADLDLRGGNMYRRCHYEADWHDPAVNQDFRGRRMQVYDRAERSRTRVTLAAARRDWNSNGDTDLEPAHEPADPWWWD